MSGPPPSASESSPGSPGDGAGFPATAWTVVQEAKGQGDLAHSRALGRLVSVYWRPVYTTLRLDWRVDVEEARDLTQEYFAVFLEKGYLDDVARERGRFRAFVKASLRNFMLNERRDARAVKRGGDACRVEMEDVLALEQGGQASGDPPDVRFEKELMRSIVQRSLADLSLACEQEGEGSAFELFREFYMAESRGDPPTYESLRARFDLGPHDVKNRLAKMRARFRQLMLGYLRDGVTSERDLVQEIREVFEA